MPPSKTFRLTAALYTCALDTNYSVFGYIVILLTKRLLRPLPLLKLKSPSSSPATAAMSQPAFHSFVELAWMTVSQYVPLQLTLAQKSLSPQLQIPATLGMDSPDLTEGPTVRYLVQPARSQLQRYKELFLHISSALRAPLSWAPSEPTRAPSIQDKPRVSPGTCSRPRHISAISRETGKPNGSYSRITITKPNLLPPPLPLRSHAQE